MATQRNYKYSTIGGDSISDVSSGQQLQLSSTERRKKLIKLAMGLTGLFAVFVVLASIR